MLSELLVIGIISPQPLLSSGGKKSLLLIVIGSQPSGEFEQEHRRVILNIASSCILCAKEELVNCWFRLDESQMALCR
jgi:hypothetical protein